MTSKICRVNDFELLAGTNLPPEIRSLFGKTPVLSHEDPKLYHGMLAKLAQELGPSDFVEWIWVKDIADLVWEIIRYRRIKTALLDAGRKEALARILGTLMDDDPITGNVLYNRADELARNWFGNAKTRKEVDALLKKHGFDEDSIIAKSFAMQAAQLETVERILAASEIRRNNTLREIEDRRQRLGRALRQASDKLIAADSSAISSRQDAAE